MKDLLATAEEALATTEERLRALIRMALENQRYADVAKLAPLADAILNVLKAAKNGDIAWSSLHTGAGGDTNKNALPQFTDALVAPRGSYPTYPKFVRFDDRLVKIAWSKKDLREYAHRAPKEVIFRVAELFQRDRAPGIPFKMDSLMPFTTNSGAEIPSYQAYLALGWFRSLGAIEARGEDGYVIAVDNLGSVIRDAWNRFPDAVNH